MARIIVMIVVVMLAAAQAFLKPHEHGEMIYTQTRGVACAACHGVRAEGQIIAHYLDDNRSSTLYAPPLTDLDVEALKAGLTRHSLAPRYFLSDEEIESLARFLSL
jgi:mono/diheme cytochrome c family protein